MQLGWSYASLVLHSHTSYNTLKCTVPQTHKTNLTTVTPCIIDDM